MILFTGGGGMHGKSAWQGGMHGREVCMVGGDMYGGGHVWWGACVAGRCA